jgi:hypothetical protein
MSAAHQGAFGTPVSRRLCVSAVNLSSRSHRLTVSCEPRSAREARQTISAALQGAFGTPVSRRLCVSAVNLSSRSHRLTVSCESSILARRFADAVAKGSATGAVLLGCCRFRAEAFDSIGAGPIRMLAKM